MSLPDGKTWLPKLPPRARPISVRGAIFIGLYAAIMAGLLGWQFWDMIYWGSPPKQLDTYLATQTGVIHYQGVVRGGDRYTLVTAQGDHVGLSCEAEYRRYQPNLCLRPLARRGIAQWLPDARDPAFTEPVVQVGYVASDQDERFQTVVYSVKLDGVELMDPARRLADAGVDPTGRTYSAFRARKARQVGRAIESAGR